MCIAFMCHTNLSHVVVGNLYVLVAYPEILRRPSFCRLNGEQGEHGRRHVVVVELLTLPKPRNHLRREIVGRAEHKVLAPEIIGGTLDVHYRSHGGAPCHSMIK